MYVVRRAKSPLFAPVRQLPEFKLLVTDRRLVDYWRKVGKWGDICRPVRADVSYAGRPPLRS